MPSEAKSTGRSFMWASRKKPSCVLGTLRRFAKLLVVPGNCGGAQGEQVRIEPQLFHDRRVVARDGEPAVRRRHDRRPLLLVADEPHPGPSRLQVIFLQEAVGHDVPEEDHHVEAGLGLLELQGVLYRVGAANPAAIRPLLVPRPDALDHGDPASPAAASFRRAAPPAPSGS